MSHRRMGGTLSASSFENRRFHRIDREVQEKEVHLNNDLSW